jgi:exoribonuclease R
MNDIIPAVLYLAKRKIYGKNKKGNYWHRARSIIDGKKFYVAIKSKEARNRYILLKRLEDNNEINKAYMHEDLGLDTDMNACILVYKHKYALFNRNKFVLSEHWHAELMRRIPSHQINTKNIISIDPPGCTDIDDAFSWKLKNDNIYVSVYIADVLYYLANADSELIKNISKKITSVYSQCINDVDHMLPKQLVSVCSLYANQSKRAVQFKFILNNSTLRLLSVSRKIINVRANLCYTDSNDYIYKLMQLLEVVNSHALVEKLMISVNSQIWNYCPRISIVKECTTFSRYALLYNETKIFHEKLQTWNYVSITSPIRRWPDIIAMSQLFNEDFQCNIDDINAKLVACKRFYSDLDVIHLIKIISETEEHALRNIHVILDGCKLVLPYYNIKIFNNYGIAMTTRFDIYLLAKSNIYERLKFIEHNN